MRKAELMNINLCIRCMKWFGITTRGYYAKHKKQGVYICIYHKYTKIYQVYKTKVPPIEIKLESEFACLIIILNSRMHTIESETINCFNAQIPTNVSFQ